MNLYRHLRSLWWARQRAIDLEILWSICKKNAPDLETARQVFIVHAINDRAWAMHYREKLWQAIQELT